MNRLKETVRKVLPRMARRHTVLAGPLRGATIVTSWHDYPGAILGRTETHLLQWFRSHVRPGQTWIDIGAHYGYTAIALSQLVGLNGRVIAFEPVLHTAGCITRTRKLNHLAQLQVVPLALSSTSSFSVVQLPTTRGMADGTIKRPDCLETFYAVSLDSIWSSVSDGHLKVDGVKIDVQGMELDVLTGMRKLLQRSHPELVVEFHSGVERSKVTDVLAECGYNIPGIPIEPGSGIWNGQYKDDKSYYFTPA